MALDTGLTVRVLDMKVLLWAVLDIFLFCIGILGLLDLFMEMICLLGKELEEAESQSHKSHLTYKRFISIIIYK